MGYDIYVSSYLKLDRPLTPEHRTYLERLNETRRVKRDPAKAEKMPDPAREAVGLPIGPDACFFVGGDYNPQDESVLDYNKAPANQPDVWCEWHPNAPGTAIDADEVTEGFQEWLAYICRTFLEPWGYKLNGTADWQGDSADDRGTIYVKDNRVEAVEDEITNPGPSWGRE